jgi:glycosyltransferase involved in cell wall biosynthesis
MLQCPLMAKDVHNAAVHAPASNGRAWKGPLVTVLIPTHNRRRSLPRALASVVRQTHRELEIFVVRDGGEDVSDIVRSFHDPRVVFIDRSENRGKPYSLNEALSRATGKYVAYLDDDDVYYPEHVQTLVDALENRTDCQAAYSDLYKVYCRELPDGSQTVLSKEVEICRDFDRYLMLFFNHVLHVSLMHRRDLLTRTGLYNENLNILIDWDMTRRLVFFTDFHHVPAVTGEFYSPVGDCDRISVQRRKDSAEYLRNVLTIRTTRPAKPWPKLEDLSIIVLADRVDQSLRDTLVNIWGHTFYPYRLYLALPEASVPSLKTEMPNVTVVPVPGHLRGEERLDSVLRHIESPYVAVLPSGLAIEDTWVENPLYALIHCLSRSLGFLIKGASPQAWAGVLRLADLQRARQVGPQMSIEDSLATAGIQMRMPTPKELPFQFDDLLRVAKLAESEGDWQSAARLYESLAVQHHNERWMATLAARAYLHAGRPLIAQNLGRQLNHERATIDTLLTEARACRQNGDLRRAIQLLADAEQRLREQVTEPFFPARQVASGQLNCT